MKGKVIAFTTKKDKCRVCCKPGKNIGDNGANYLIEVSKLKLDCVFVTLPNYLAPKVTKDFLKKVFKLGKRPKLKNGIIII